jgi:hypothetical protein
MKKIISLLFVGILYSANLYAEEVKNCKDVKVDKKLGKGLSGIKCLAADGKFKLKTESTLTDWISGEKKFKFPNPITGIKNIGKALDPSQGFKKTQEAIEEKATRNKEKK